MVEKYLIMVDPYHNNNKYYRMIPDGNRQTFTIIYGRVGTAGMKKSYPISDWDKILQSKLKKGYEDVTDLQQGNIKSDSDSINFEDDVPQSVREILLNLISRSRQIVRKNYNIAASVVTEKMLDEAKQLLIELSAKSEVWDFNDTLAKLFKVIPRRMGNVYDCIATSRDEFEHIVNREYSLLQNMSVVTDKKLNEAVKKEHVSLADLGITFEECTDKQTEKIRSMLDDRTKRHFVRAWKVTNIEGEKKFKEYCQKNDISKIHSLFHGSRTENWWSILCNRLKLNPVNAVIAGKMFGYGIYTAPKAFKAFGYSSCSSAYWSHSSESKGYIGIFKVAYGNPKNVDTHSSEYYTLTKDSFKKKYPDYDCLHAHAGKVLKNDEVIVYDEAAITIQYLIEVAE